MTKPEGEKWTNKESVVSEIDLTVLKRAKTYLENEQFWERSKDRYCLHWEKKSLFCAIALAQKEIDGQYKHGSVPLQHIRFQIDEQYPERWKIHPIMEFNNHSETDFQDVKNLLDETIIQLEKRLQRGKAKTDAG